MKNNAPGWMVFVAVTLPTNHATTSIFAVKMKDFIDFLLGLITYSFLTEIVYYSNTMNRTSFVPLQNISNINN